MMKAPFKAKQYIKDRQSLQSYECTVCFDLDPNVRRCSGPCKAAICLRCATYICQNSKNPSCPQRCSKKLALEPIPSLKMQFLCPFGGEKCKIEIIGMQALAQHKCQYMSQQALENEMKSEEYVCHKGHPLLFIKAITRECADCGERRICKSYCEKCSRSNKTVAFCHDCRAIPCTKKMCPIGDQYTKETVSDTSKFCVLCGFCVFLYSDHCYFDKGCNFRFCGPCFQKLPEQHHLIPLKTNILYTQKRAEMKQKKTKNQQNQHYLDIDFDGSSFQDYQSDQNDNLVDEEVNEGQYEQSLDEPLDYQYDEFGEELNMGFAVNGNHLDIDENDINSENQSNQYANWLL